MWPSGRSPALLVLFLALAVYCNTDKIDDDKRFKSDSVRGVYKRAAVAADNGICSDIGKDVLDRGGNAVESAIATAVCIGVHDPHSSGLGGGHFMNVYMKNSRSCFIFDAREIAPLKVDRKVYEKNATLAFKGWMSIAVPGEVHGFWTAYQKFGGNIPWRDLWTPTIRLCREGVLISPAVDKILKEKAKDIVNNSYFTDYVNPKTKKTLQAGDVIKLPLLADTMEKIANSSDPVKLFYDSDWTDQMIREIQYNGGILTREELRNYSTKFGPKERPPVYTRLNNNITFCTPPPPSSASLATSIMTVLDEFNMSAIDPRNTSAVALLFHRFIEATKFAYGVRAQFGDMDFVKQAFGLAQEVNNKPYAKSIRSKINDKSWPTPDHYGLDPGRPDHGTAHISVVDQYGNAVALTLSINYYFGARVCSRLTGIIYNDEMEDFSIKDSVNVFEVVPTPRNRIQPGKRPQSSMSPIIKFDSHTGQVQTVLGAAGGIKIIAATSQVFMRLMYLNETIKEAIDAPRIYHQLLPYKATYEAGFPLEIVERLNTTHRQVVSSAVHSFFSVVCAINRLSNGFLEANSDYRKGGGYTAGF